MAKPESATEPNVYLQSCPSRELLVRVADKWASLIIVALAERPCRFGELRRHVEGVSQKMLTQTLRNLERDGLVKRTVFTGRPLRVEYSLTSLGHDLTKVLNPLLQWAEAHLPDVLEQRNNYDSEYSQLHDTGQG